MTDRRIDEKELLHQTAVLAEDLYTAQLRENAYSLTKLRHLVVGGDELEKSVQAAERELKKPEIKQAICRALQSANNDIRTVAKLVAAALLPLSLHGAISIQPTAIGFATAAVIVFKAGVSAYCGEAKPGK
jgi:hypothetical protein